MANSSLEKVIARLAKGQPVPAVLLLGAESYMRQACRERIVEAAVDPAMRGWGVSRFSAEDDDLSMILGQARTVPMLAQRQVVIVRDLEAIEQSSESKRDAATEALAAYLNDPAPFTVLILDAAALDRRMKLAKMLDERTVVIPAESPADPGERLRMAGSLAVEMAREQNTIIDADAAELLADLCNSSLAAIHSEVEKLAAYAGPGQPIRRGDVEALVVSEKKYSVWELAEVLASRQRARAFIFLDTLLREGEQPPALVGAMAWMFRTLLQVHDFGRITADQAASKLRMRYKTAELAVAQARKIPRKQLVDGLQALYEADSRLKSRGADSRVIMEFLLARLTA